MPFEVKTYFQVELRDQVAALAGGPTKQKGIDTIWTKVGEVCSGEKKARALLKALATAGKNYKETLLVLDYHYEHFQEVTLADLAASLGQANFNMTQSPTHQAYFQTLGSRPKKHRNGDEDYTPPLTTDGTVSGRDYVNAEGYIKKPRPIIEWYVNDSSHMRFFTRHKDPTVWYTYGGTHVGPPYNYANPEWWISYRPGYWIRYV
jgi:hypothetical protein